MNGTATDSAGRRALRVLAASAAAVVCCLALLLAVTGGVVAGHALLGTVALLGLLLAGCAGQRRPDAPAVAADSRRTHATVEVAGPQLLEEPDPWQPERELPDSDPRDALTGLATGALLAEQTADALAARDRTGGEVALLHCDCDGFTGVNESLGHDLGDKVLADMAGRLLLAVRESDTVTRLDGAGFAVLCTDMDAAVAAGTVAQRLLRACAVPFELGERSIHLTVSIGVSVARAETTAESLLREAGEAMVTAKSDGCGRLATFEQALAASADPAPTGSARAVATGCRRRTG